MAYSPTQDQQRALAHSMYAQGADGVSLYNHFEVMHGGGGAHAPFYPLALHDTHHLRSPSCTQQGRRHYVFDATWGGFSGFLEDRTSTGAVKAQRAILARPDGADDYRFRLYEEFDRIAAAQLLFRAYHLTVHDELEITLNGRPVPAKGLRRRDDEVRLDLRPEEFPHEYAEGAMRRERRPFVTYWFPLTGALCRRGENRLGLRLMRSDPFVQESIVVEEVEVFVVPLLGSD